MKIYWQNFIFLRKELKILLLISSLIILFIEFIGFSYDEIFPKANIIANIILKVSYSYISALIFYFLVVHYKRQDEKRKFYSILKSKINIFIQAHDRIFEGISILNGNVEIDLTNQDEIKTYLKNVDPRADFTVIGYLKNYDPTANYDVKKFEGFEYVSWREHLFIVAKDTRRDVEKIFLQSSLIEVELINLLDNLNENMLFNQIRFFNDITIGNTTFEAFYTYFFEYTCVIKKLKDYITKELDKYILQN